MPLPHARRQQKRVSRGSSVPAKRLRTSRGTASQPIDIDATPSQIRFYASPYETLAAATSQATDTTLIEPSPPSILLNAAIVASTNDTDAATASTADPLPDEPATDLDSHFADDFEGINWDTLLAYGKPPRTLKHKKSWVFQHGYRVASLRDLSRTFWVCRHCHQHNAVGIKYILEVTKSTSAAITHLQLNRPGHSFDRAGKKAGLILPAGQRSLQFINQQGLIVQQSIANTIGNFDVQAFRYAAVRWVIENNHPLREFETPAFKQMIAYANPEAAAALWVSHQSVSAYVLRLYHCLQPLVTASLSQATSRIHISFDGWTARGGKRGFFGVVAHFADASGTIRDLPIALPQLAGAHTGDRIGEVVATTLRTFNISGAQLGCFILDNAFANDRAIHCLSREFEFNALHRRLHCAPHTLNLVGQTVIQGFDLDACNNSSDAYAEETQYLSRAGTAAKRDRYQNSI
ncbi:hypothetical protein KJE20_13983 [Pyrenophora tritici-repentis]|nr:hypothetical protein KJE20_13983 [Pyrenophora tritici-repentis]